MPMLGHALPGVGIERSTEGVTWLVRLQWGHALPGVEMSSRAACSSAATRSFNGATPFQAWRWARYPPMPKKHPLQWCHAFPGVATRLVTGIPEAFVMLQGSHAFRGVETGLRVSMPTAGTCFNGATPFQAWRRGRRSCRRRDRRCFNGATPFPGVEAPIDQVVHNILLLASMGPRLSRRGDRRHRGLVRHHELTSMGPRPSRRGDGALVYTAAATWFQLQWGHALPGVEM